MSTTVFTTADSTGAQRCHDGASAAIRISRVVVLRRGAPGLGSSSQTPALQPHANAYSKSAAHQGGSSPLRRAARYAGPLPLIQVLLPHLRVRRGVCWAAGSAASANVLSEAPNSARLPHSDADERIADGG